MKSTRHSFVLVEWSDDKVEFFESEGFVWWSFFVNEGAVHHFEDVVVVHVVAAHFKSVFEFFEVDGSVFVLIQKSENSSDSVLGSDFSDSSSGDVNEFVEFNGSIGFFKFVDNTDDEWVSSVNT